MPINDPFPWELNDRALEERLRTLFQESMALQSGPSERRPKSPIVGAFYFDTDLKKPIWWSGSHWQDATGAIV